MNATASRTPILTLRMIILRDSSATETHRQTCAGAEGHSRPEAPEERTLGERRLGERQPPVFTP
ncbi:hypothetical protein Plo01_74180 [Planobispora longispora]|uniref:Uncharacterized protein n=1 Tax=Planobispora longispora TaxID=28887 RepID=A0A8J3W8S5_9ACTN|nr:hypothetical protein GCM10020093_117840 [Planobispora longispora]BFE89268.1 hypothetical protein GCM10020093_118700 [Planobispora longispora]BFE89424.1 hypothetical protein GCM10020093_120260 [Planobispora longispora]GIH80989.1 hypothetical protein Plo01_74180 [Planobispora longispora]